MLKLSFRSKRFAPTHTIYFEDEWNQYEMQVQVDEVDGMAWDEDGEAVAERKRLGAPW